MEKNRKILLEALQKLPEYPPDNKLWERMETSLESVSFNSAFHRLSQIEPPEIIWKHIDEELINREYRAKLKSLVKWSLVAAAVLVLGYFIFTAVNTYNNSISYSEELQTTRYFLQWQDDDAVVDQTLALICVEKPEVCQSSEFKKMERELEFLYQSKQTIVKQMSQYATNCDLELLLTKIELERTDIINQIVAIVN